VETATGDANETGQGTGSTVQGTNNGSGSSRRTVSVSSDRPSKRRKTVELPNHLIQKYENWEKVVREKTRRKMFPYMQFYDDKETEWGSRFQKHICKWASIDKKDAQHFWKHSGRAAAEHAIKKRRTNTLNTNMKRMFMSKYIRGGQDAST
jgi:hypothetical protein